MSSQSFELCELPLKVQTGRQGGVLPCLFYPVWQKTQQRRGFTALWTGRQGERSKFRSREMMWWARIMLSWI